MNVLRQIGQKLFYYRRRPNAEMRAFSVHMLTASGAYLAFLALVAAGESRFIDMFWWLGFALLVDGIDGPIARKLKVKEVLPRWSGEQLDNVIDYVTFVLIPAYALYQSGMIGQFMSFVCAALIVVSSAIYYANMGMKTHAGLHALCDPGERVDRDDRRLRGGGADLPADLFYPSGPGGAAEAAEPDGLPRLVRPFRRGAAAALRQPDMARLGDQHHGPLCFGHRCGVAGLSAAGRAGRIKKKPDWEVARW
jgi:hypothetical protein